MATAVPVKLEMYGRDRDNIMSWVRSNMLNKQQYCVPVKSLFGLLRIGKVTEAYSDLKKLGDEIKVGELKPSKSKSKQPKPEHKRSTVTLDTMLTYCCWVHSRKKYSECTYRRAQACFAYARDMMVQMEDTLELVNHLHAMNGLAGKAQFSTMLATDVVDACKAKNGSVKPETAFAVYELVEKVMQDPTTDKQVQQAKIISVVLQLKKGDQSSELPDQASVVAWVNKTQKIQAAIAERRKQEIRNRSEEIRPDGRP